MSKKMLVNATHHEENRVAIVEDGILTELDIEVAGFGPTKGNIYRAVVVRVESGLQAAFVDYGAERLGFLQIDEINYSAVKPGYQPAEDGRRPRITDLLQRGQEILVQITKEERGTKGAALTTYLSLAGRYMVIMPGSQTRGVSRKAESDSQRKELKKAMSSLDMTENVGYIVRTAALNQTREELERDYRYLIRLYESIMELDKKVKVAPALLYKESNLIIRSIRDYFTTDMDEVMIDDPQVFNEARDFFQMVMPDYAKLVKLHQERRPIFSRYQIEEQIETLSRNKVQLPSGGSIVIDPTEALVAIDVNSGKMSSEQGVEATATKTNLEAAKEVGRQLRLRDLGGLVVIDFIDMRDRKNMREVEKELKKSLENDKARVSIGRISQFGLLEMSRQRLKATLATGSYLPCPHCDGAGRLKSPESQAVSLLRKIHASAAKGQVSRIDAQLPRDVAAYLLNHKREELVTMERDHQLKIHIHGNRDFLADQVEIEIQKKEKDKAPQPEFVAAWLLPSAYEESTEKQAVEPDQEEAPDSSAVPAKKRRRRKRRKAPEGTAAEPASEKTTPAQAPSVDTGQSEQAGQTAIQTDTAASPLEPAPVAAKKPQRRRRTPSKTKSTVTDSTEQGTPPEHPLEQMAPDQTDKNPVQEDKPKRNRPRRAPRKTPSQSDPASTEPQQTAEGHGSNPVQVAAETSTVDASAPAKKAPTRRPRRTAVKKAASDAVKQSSAEQANATDQKIVAQAAEEKPKPRRRRPARKKTEPEPTTEA